MNPKNTFGRASSEPGCPRGSQRALTLKTAIIRATQLERRNEGGLGKITLSPCSRKMLKPSCHMVKMDSRSIKGHFSDLHNFCLQLNISVGFPTVSEGRGTSKFNSQSLNL